MYLSSLQKFILKTALSNINSESLTLYSDAQESSVIKSKNKTDTLKKKLLTSSINEFLKIKKEIEMNQIKYPVTNFGIIEISNEKRCKKDIIFIILEVFRCAVRCKSTFSTF